MAGEESEGASGRDTSSKSAEGRRCYHDSEGVSFVGGTLDFFTFFISFCRRNSPIFWHFEKFKKISAVIGTKGRQGTLRRNASPIIIMVHKPPTKWPHVMCYTFNSCNLNSADLS